MLHVLSGPGIKIWVLDCTGYLNIQKMPQILIIFGRIQRLRVRNKVLKKKLEIVNFVMK